MALVSADFQKLIKYVYKQEKLSKTKRAKSAIRDKEDGFDKGELIRGRIR